MHAVKFARSTIQKAGELLSGGHSSSSITRCNLLFKRQGKAKVKQVSTDYNPCCDLALSLIIWCDLES